MLLAQLCNLLFVLSFALASSSCDAFFTPSEFSAVRHICRFQLEQRFLKIDSLFHIFGDFVAELYNAFVERYARRARFAFVVSCRCIFITIARTSVVAMIL